MKSPVTLSLLAILAVVAVVSSGTSASANPFPRPKLVHVPLEAIFIPSGFDSNDNVQIVLHGELESTCQKAIPPKVKVNHRKRTVYVSARANLYTGCFCVDVPVPFSHTIDLGIMSEGGYRVVELDAKGRVAKEAFIPVALNTSSAPDDHLYAPVKQVIVDRSATQPTVLLTGSFPNDCMTMSEVRVIKKTARVVELLPITAYDSTRSCGTTTVPFVSRVELGADIQGEVLVHVRALNGQSLNQVERF